MRRAIWFLAAGIVASLVASHVGHWFFVSRLQDWPAFFGGMFNFLLTTIGLGIALLLGSLAFDRPLRGNIALAGIGAACGLVTNPVFDQLAVAAWRVAYVEPEFSRICRDAHIDVRPVEVRPIGVLLSDRSGVSAEFLLNQSELQFVEREAKHKPQNEVGAAYERLEVQGDRGRRSSFQPGAETRFKITPMSTPDAPLEASLSIEFVDKDRTIVQRKVRLARRSDARTFASASIYWHKTLEKTCPEDGSMNEIYATNLLLRAMNMPEVPLVAR